MTVQNIVVAGKSGAGKQPRVDVLAEAYQLTQLSTGNIFREYLGHYGKIRESVNVAGLWSEAGFASDADIRQALGAAAASKGIAVEDAMLGYKAAEYVDRGRFVPDDITNALFAAAFRKANGQGLILDGYPRTPEQSDFLLGLLKETGTRIDLLLIVDNEDEAIVARTIGRRICPSKTCGKVYHLEYRPPTADGNCAVCGTTVVHRSDDTEEKIRMRLGEYQAKALPAIQRLEAAKIPCVSVNGNLPVFTDEAIRASVFSVVKPLLG